MRTVPALFLFLIATTAGAQLVGTDEQSYGPFTPGPGDRSFAIAAGAGRILLVWSEESVIHTAPLDLDGRLTGPINTIPVRRRDHHAASPIVTTDGERFLIIWTELDPYRFDPEAVTGVMTGADGVPLAQPRSFGDAVDEPSVVWDGIAFRVYSDATYSIDRHNVVRRERGAAPRRVPFATPEANGWVTWGNTANTPQYCFGRPCGVARAWYQLDWTVVTRREVHYGRLREEGYLSRTPAVVAEGKNLLIVWTTDHGLSGLRIDDGEAGKVFDIRHSIEGSPSAAGKLVVFESNGDIFGSAVTGDAFGQPFPISTSGDFDTLPTVLAVGYDRYLVAYVREHSPSSISLVGRFVTAP